MRIAQFLWNMDPADGGVVRAVLDLCPALAAAGHKPVLLCCISGAVPEAWFQSDRPPSEPRAVRLQRPARLKWLSRAARIGAEAVIRESDVVHIHGMWVACNFQIARLCRRLGKPYILSPHGMLDDWSMEQHAIRKRVLLISGYRTVLEHAAAVHCTAEAERQQARKWFPRGHAAVVPLLMNLDPFRSLPGPDPARRTFGIDSGHGPVVLFIGRLHPKKGAHVLLEAADELRRRGRTFQLIIAGEGEAGYVERLKQAAGRLSPVACRFVGFVSDTTKLSLYQAADVVVLPTEQENFGYVVVEAMAAATPVLTTRAVALWPELDRAKAIALCEPTAASVAAELERLLADPAAGKALGERARAWCFQNLDAVAAVQPFINMYQAAAATGGSAGSGR